MKNIFILIILFISLSGKACDICNIYEYANRKNKNYIGLYYRYRFFNGYAFQNDPHDFHLNTENLRDSKARTNHEPNFDEASVNKSPKDYQLFQTIEIRGNYVLKEKINIQAIIPYVWNTVYYKQSITFPKQMIDTTLRLSGIGDPILAFDYIQVFETGMIRHILKPGIGIKFPLGKYDAIGANGRRYEYDIQAGTGSFDFILRANYTITNDTWGVDAFINHRLNTWGKNDMLLGDKSNLMLTTYYTLKIKELSILPRIGVYYEWALRDRIHKEIINFSGGNTFFLQTGIDLMYKNFIIQSLYQHPLRENLNGQVIGNAGRFNVGVIYNFD